MEWGQLTKVELSGYKSIKEMSLSLSNLNVLIGPNGAGKSNFIGFFKFLTELLEKNFQFYIRTHGTAETFLYFGSKQTEEIKFNLVFSPNYYSVRLATALDSRLLFKEEYVYYVTSEGKVKKYELKRTSYEETALFDNEPLAVAKVAKWASYHLKNWKVYHFHDTSDTALMKKDSEVNDNKELYSQAQNLAAFLYSIKDTPHYQKIVETIQRVAPFFQDFRLRPDKRDPNLIRLRWKHRASEIEFDANSLSDGTVRFICLVTLLLQPDLPSMIIIDEPELGLHPFALHLLGQLLKNASTKTQILISTQSVILINQFSYQDLIVVDQINNTTQFKRLNEEDVKAWLDDYQMGEMWDKNLIGGNPA